VSRSAGVRRHGAVAERTIVLVAALIGGQLVLAPVAHAGAPLPACRIDDVTSRFDELHQWRKTLLDTIYRVPRTYAPTDLVSTNVAGVPGPFRVRAVVIPDLRDMTADAAAAGAALALNSGYRSFRKQKRSFRSYVKQVGFEQAIRYAARPGHSEHQLGTTIDFRSAGDDSPPWAYDDWARTPAGAWMARKAWRYGFVMSYPKGMRHESCYSYEPWHYRYVGRARAAAVHEAGVTLRRYLWEHHETAP
jgi:zinc D-Ala-D-Ala carboxypeptidase